MTKFVRIGSSKADAYNYESVAGAIAVVVAELSHSFNVSIIYPHSKVQQGRNWNIQKEDAIFLEPSAVQEVDLTMYEESGHMVQIGGDSASEFGYLPILGAEAVILYEDKEEDWVRVKITAARNEGLVDTVWKVKRSDCWVTGKQSVASTHPTKREPVVAKKRRTDNTPKVAVQDMLDQLLEQTAEKKKRESLFLVPTDTFAEQMDYVEAVGQQCAVEYTEPSYIHVLVLTGPIAGQYRDIHIEDAVPQNSSPEKEIIVLVNPFEKQITFFPEERLRDATFAITVEDMIRTKWIMKKHPLDTIIGDFGYPQVDIDTCIQEHQIPEESP